MITEYYVNFETAKLLVKKGFDFNAEYESYYTLKGEIVYFKDKTQDINMAPRITLQMAMKWLREDKKILISIFCHIDKGYWFCIQHFINSPYKFATSESIHRREEILGKIQYYNTYERACEVAIKYCLENLI